MKQTLLLILLHMSVGAKAQPPLTCHELKSYNSFFSFNGMQPDTSCIQLYRYKDMTMYRLSYGYTCGQPGNITTVVMTDTSEQSAMPVYDSMPGLPAAFNMYKKISPEEERIMDSIRQPCSETRYHYLVFKNGDQQGYNYDPADNFMFKKSQWVIVDSVLKYSNLGSPDIYDGIPVDRWRKISSAYDGNGVLQEIYELWEDNEKMASYYLSFDSSLENTGMSLSRKFDDKWHSKLCGLRIISYKAALKKCCVNWEMDSIEMYKSLNSVPVYNNSQVMGYFNSFEELYKKEKPGLTKQ